MTDTAPTPLAEVYQVYERLRLVAKSQSNRRLYRCSLRNFNKSLGREATTADLTDETLCDFISYRIGQGRIPATVNSDLNRLLALWRFAARKGYVKHWPDVRLLDEYKRIPSAWTIEQIGVLLHAIKGHADDVCTAKELCGVPPVIWWTALIEVLYVTGIRIGAASRMQPNDFDKYTRRLLVRAEIQKQKADQMFALPERVAKLLCECVAATSSKYIFGYTFSESTLYGKLRKLLKLAGLPSTRRDMFHRIRRTSATMAELHIGKGAAFHHLGHSSPKVTAKYIDTSVLPDSDIPCRLPPLAVPSKNETAVAQARRLLAADQFDVADIVAAIDLLTLSRRTLAGLSGVLQARIMAMTEKGGPLSPADEKKLRETLQQLIRDRFQKGGAA